MTDSRDLPNRSATLILEVGEDLVEFLGAEAAPDMALFHDGLSGYATQNLSSYNIYARVNSHSYSLLLVGSTIAPAVRYS